MDALGEAKFRVGAWVIAPRLNSLSNNGRTLHVEPKVMQVLVCLAEAGDVVSKERLMSRVWAGTFVTDDVLTRSISELRKAFEDDPKNPRFIQTIPKGGYRLLIPAERLSSSSNGSAAPTADAERQLTPPMKAAPGARRVAPLAVVLAALGAVALTIFALRRLSTASSAGLPVVSPQRTVLAVLPFQNLNKDASQEYFADGLTAEMISQLGRLPSDRLGVIAWNSMIRYKGAKRSEAEIGGELGANYILEGTVRRENQRVRITAELLKVGDRSHIWANSYDGDLGDVLAVQSRIAREIAGEIQLQLTPEQQARLDNPAHVNAEGYDAYLKARTDANGFSAMNRSGELLQQAIRLTPDYAPPYVALAAFYRGQASFGYAASKPAYARARAAAEKALQLEPGLASAHRELAWVDWRGDWNFAAADKEYQLALELNPGEELTHEAYSLYLKSTGRYQGALAEINRSLELSPMLPISHANAGTVLGLLQRDDDAMRQFRRGVELNPRDAYVRERMGAVLLWQGKTDEAIQEFLTAVQLSDRQPEKLAWLGYALARRGNSQEAKAVLEEILRNSQKQYTSPFYVAMLYAGLGDKDLAFSWLEKAYNEHDEWMVYLKIYPEFASLHSDARFQDLVQRVGLP